MNIIPIDLRVENISNPLGIDVISPRFSWKIEGEPDSPRQTAYRILASSSVKFLDEGKTDIWDSGKVLTENSVFIPYDGPELLSRQRIYWMVQVWDDEGNKTVSEITWFELGLLQRSDWQGQFIGPPCCRKGGRGYHSAVLPIKDNPEFWVQIDLKNSVKFDRFLIHPCHYREQGETGIAFGFPRQFKLDISLTTDFSDAVTIYQSDSELNINNLTPIEINLEKPQVARFIRFQVIKPVVLEDGNALFVLGAIQVFGDTVDLALHKPVTAANHLKSSVPAGSYDWHPACLTDGVINPDIPETNDQGDGNLLFHFIKIASEFSKARAYITARGWYELKINDKKIGDAVLDPAWSVTDKRLLYNTWDIGDYLNIGNNTVTLQIGNGWPMDPAAMLQIYIDYENGTEEVLFTDNSWKIAKSGLMANNIYHGECFDAGIEELDGLQKNLDATAPVVVYSQYNPVLTAQMLPPVRVIDCLTPVDISEPEPGVFVFDFGQNISGGVKLKVKDAGPEDKIKLRYSELIFDNGTVWTDDKQTQMRKEKMLNVTDGMINTANLRTARATDTYICKGNSQIEIWEPKFTCHGFRFVEITGFPGIPEKETLTANVVHTDFSPRGDFNCSDELLNKVQQAVKWTLKTNFIGHPSDCPQRDERQGWMMDGQVVSEAFLYNFDVYNGYRKWLTDMRDSQYENGALGDTVPFTLGRSGMDPTWEAAMIIVAWNLYLHYGDTKVIAENFEAMNRWINYFAEKFPSGIITGGRYGDWLEFDHTPVELVDSGYFYYCVTLFNKIANVLNFKKVAEKTQELKNNLAIAFNEHFYNVEKKCYGTNSQLSNAFPLYLGLVSEKNISTVVNNIKMDIEKRNIHLSTGMPGTKIIMEVLCKFGLHELAYKIAQSTEFPGWGYMIAHQATTFWEHWELITGDGMNSHNHPPFASIGSWFMKYVAGIRADENTPGFRKVKICPYFTDSLDFASASLNSVYGKISVSWKRTKKDILLKVVLPSCCNGEIIIHPAVSYQLTQTNTYSIAGGYHEFKFTKQ